MRILIGFDGSPSASAALETVLRFPWPERSDARCVVALGGVPLLSPALTAAAHDALRKLGSSAQRRLQARWPSAELRVTPASPAVALKNEAHRIHADVIALGWRGHGSFRRLLLGSVSRRVAENADCSVMIVRGPAAKRGAPRRFVIGYDGSANARRAVRFVARLHPPRAGRVLLVGAVEPLYTPPVSRHTLAMRHQVMAAVREAEAKRLRHAARRLARAAEDLRARGWSVRTRIVRTAPLFGLLDAVSEIRADALVVGAQGTSGLSRVLLGSVAAGALDRCPCPVVVAR
jgi:nucleotide-binding universal stress UspA family protein